MKIIFYILLILLLTGCVTTSDYLYTPYKTFYSQPPGKPKSWPQPIQLEDIDGSGIYVFTNGKYWYSGPRQMETKGWIPITGGQPGQWPLPGQVWEMEVCFVEVR
jgi:hypothetical protein